MSTGVQQPSARFCFFIAGLLYFESNSYGLMVKQDTDTDTDMDTDLLKTAA